MNFISLPSGYIININQLSLVKPNKEGKYIDIIFSSGASTGNSQSIKSHWLNTSVTGESVAYFLDALDKEGIDTSYLRESIK